jgi:hypothetical protein
MFPGAPFKEKDVLHAEPKRREPIVQDTILNRVPSLLTVTQNPQNRFLVLHQILSLQDL